jgi:uncharacterized damage-inducible protein DinB
MDVEIPAGSEPQVAMASASLEAGQRRIFDLIAPLTPEQLEQVPAGLANSIATLVVHVAATELRMASRLRGPGAEIPAAQRAAYRLDLPQNPLPAISGETADTLRNKAVQARALLREAFAGLRAADLGRELAAGPDRTITPRWMLVMLPLHQVQHYGQMQMVRRLL